MTKKILVPLDLPADPVNPLEAATKQYADLKVAKAGDTMTGRLNVSTPTDTMPLRLFNTLGTDGPMIDFVNNGVTQGQVGPNTLSSSFRMYSPTTPLLLSSLTGSVLLDGNGKRSGEFKDGILNIGDTTVAANNGNSPLRLYGTTTQSYISFYHGATPQTRSGQVGFANATDLRMVNEITNGDIYFTVAGTGEIGRFQNSLGYFLVGKTANDQATNGFQVNPGSQCQTNSTGNTPGYAMNKIGAGVAAGHDYFHFRINGTAIGSVTRNASTSAVLYNTSSDYRLKNVLGPITNTLDRIKLLKPRRITWKIDPTEQEQDAFLAHEVTPAAPWAVTGEKDAVADEDNEDAGLVKGRMIPQQLDSTRLIPLLTAAVQELTSRVEALEAV